MGNVLYTLEWLQEVEEELKKNAEDKKSLWRLILQAARFSCGG